MSAALPAQAAASAPDPAAWEALDCVCYPDGADCACTAQEVAARHHAAGTPGLPPPPADIRRAWAAEAASVEGYPPAAELELLTDRELARTLLASWLDYCRDKGLTS